MNRFSALEAKWRRYRKRLWLRRTAFTLSAAAILGVGGYALNNLEAFIILTPKKDEIASVPTSQNTPKVDTETHKTLQKDDFSQKPTLHVVNGAFDQKTPTILGENNLESLNNEECYIVKATVLNIRERPDLRAKILSRYVRGDEVCTRLVEGNWLFSGIGWIYNGGGTLSDVNEEEILSAPLEESIAINTTDKNLPHKNKFIMQNAKNPTQKMDQPKRSAPPKSTLKITSSVLDPKEQRNFYHHRYEKEPNYDSAIVLAQSYLSTKEYNKAYQWALNANSHKKNSTESWAIFAKSLYFSGKKKEAIDILSQYVKFDSSGELSRLLEEMTSGDLKEAE